MPVYDHRTRECCPHEASQRKQFGVIRRAIMGRPRRPHELDRLPNPRFAKEVLRGRSGAG